MIIPFKKQIRKKFSDFVQSELSQTKAELSQTKAELSQTKSELSQTKAELMQTKVELTQTKAKADILQKQLYTFSNYVENEKRSIISNFEQIAGATGNRKVVYTCLTGNYDVLSLPEYVDYNWDYVCFTDDEDLLRLKHYGVWKINSLQFSELDDTRNSRWHKTHPHVLFPRYEESLWIDSNITIRSGWIFSQFEKNTKMLIPLHFERDCIYDEGEAVRHRDDERKIQEEIAFFKAQDFPRHYGLNETNCIYRRHNEDELVDIMEEWWKYIRNYSKRDQLSLSYVLWTHGIKPTDVAIPNLRSRYRDITFTFHPVALNTLCSLPNYSLGVCEIKYSIDICEVSIGLSKICGWAFVPNRKCTILIGNDSKLYVAESSSLKIIYTGAESKFGYEKEIYLPTMVCRPDVKNLFHLETDEVGFQVEVDTLLASFTIYLVDDDEKKIYFTTYQCPMV